MLGNEGQHSCISNRVGFLQLIIVGEFRVGLNVEKLAVERVGEEVTALQIDVGLDYEEFGSAAWRSAAGRTGKVENKAFILGAQRFVSSQAELGVERQAVQLLARVLRQLVCRVRQHRKVGCVTDLQLQSGIRRIPVCRPIVPIPQILAYIHRNRRRARIGIGDRESYHKRRISGVIIGSYKGGEFGFVGSSQLRTAVDDTSGCQLDEFEDEEGEKEDDDWDGEQAAAEVCQLMSVLICQVGFSFEDVQLRYELHPHLNYFVYYK